MGPHRRQRAKSTQKKIRREAHSQRKEAAEKTGVGVGVGVSAVERAALTSRRPGQSKQTGSVGQRSVRGEHSQRPSSDAVQGCDGGRSLSEPGRRHFLRTVRRPP